MFLGYWFGELVEEMPELESFAKTGS